MELMKRNVYIQLDTKIEEQGQQTDSITQGYRGIAYRKGKLDVLLFTDEQNEFGSIRNFITIQKDKMAVKRSGAVSMQQIFLVGQKTECMYHHPYGRFLFEIVTERIDVAYSEGHTLSEVMVKYKMLTHDVVSNYTLTLAIMEEK